MLGVSLGSATRDHEVTVDLFGEKVHMARRGTGGDLEAAAAMIRAADGQVDAIGLGGIDAYLYAGGRKYPVRDGVRLTEQARVTPVVDGSGIKNTVERDAVFYLLEHTDLLTPKTPVLMVSALDRFGMAEAFATIGCPVVFGDLIFTTGIPYPITSLDELSEIARKTLPEMAKLPMHLLYPMGASQEAAPAKGYEKYYDAARVVAGDWHLIRKYLPDHLDGRVILTNTTTQADVDMLLRRGAGALVTTTPAMGGRSFGTNMLEAAMVAVFGQAGQGEEAHLERVRAINLAPRIERFRG